MPANDHSSRPSQAVNAYAIRRVNPFLGVLQIIETEAGRAISANGVVWDIEVLAKRSSAAWGSLNRQHRDKAYYRYGLWSLADGLISRPLAPHLDTDPLTHKCHELIQCVRQHLDLLPFKLNDQRELWLFDSAGSRPLALLASATPNSQPVSPEPRYWSACIGANGVPSQRRFPSSKGLEAQVKLRAGFNIRKHWIQRLEDGSGIVENTDTRIAAEDFPAFLLDDDWPESDQSKRATAYFEWIAPSLLTLQTLDSQQRRQLEQTLYVQAVSVEHHWHLYPEIIDQKAVKAARVQCRLQQSGRT